MHILDQDSKNNQLQVQTPSVVDLSSSPLNQLISYAFPLATHYTKKFFNHFSHHSTQEAFKVILIISHLHARKMASFLTKIKKKKKTTTIS